MGRQQITRVIIRKAKKGDLPSINQLTVELIRTLDRIEGTDIAFVSRNSRSLLRCANSHLLVAEVGTTVVGLVHFTTRRTILHRNPSGLIDELTVVRDCRRVGIGRQLLRAAIHRCRELGCCEVEVSTEKTNRIARKFYESCGFEERGILLEMDLSKSIEQA